MTYYNNHISNSKRFKKIWKFLFKNCNKKYKKKTKKFKLQKPKIKKCLKKIILSFKKFKIQKPNNTKKSL